MPPLCKGRCLFVKKTEGLLKIRTIDKITNILYTENSINTVGTDVLGGP